MKNRYKRKAYYIDEDIVIEGYKDKRGFHPNKNIECGFGTQKTTKRDIGKQLFFSLTDLRQLCGNLEIITK